MDKEPYGIISEIYQNPVLETSPIRMNYVNSDFDLKSVKEARDTINTVIQEKRSNLGLADIRELNLLPAQATNLRDEIVKDTRWRNGLTEIVSTLAPDISGIDSQTKIDAITLPWWNAAVLARQDGKYDSSTPSLSIDAVVSHSYITQLTRSITIPAQHKTEAMAVINVLVTKDDFVVLGIRGGRSHTNVLSVVPAGSVEYHTGKNPLFETLYAEHFEETGLAKDQIKSAEFIGRILDPREKCALYVSRSHTTLYFSELVSLWGSAMDNREHKFLIPIKNTPQEAINTIRSHMYRPEYVNPKSVTLTTLENVNTIHPSAVSSLLTHYAQREGGQWGKKAENTLNGLYVFKE